MNRCDLFNKKKGACERIEPSNRPVNLWHSGRKLHQQKNKNQKPGTARTGESAKPNLRDPIEHLAGPLTVSHVLTHAALKS